ncbi:hypothetical protein SODALDRAFT_298432 [Sodiomyces alkalinus F11]|uniref:MYND-type domain-containing protein n=1 Tax=Sodiomyces alkalinus (strain CBS 110278 / VKM F-3762 / F11) TaxID=1314773 RepID=A0A3N2PQN2_SODAK|nr:hypothetical protein SODALDRAFT_298432 [Sodiomyces alkalinus F11]ROT36821.1 hypothetical protein SODALDRAFT_298432 [Sodiomyces alkalinus F11]
MATPRFICADWAPDNTACQKAGNFACKNCLLVGYCGPTCQRSHWASHKADCKSNLRKETWQPNWALENRRPAFVGPGQQFGGKKYLWGNMPAFDVLNLESNEGVDYDGQLNLLFAASGDLRNLVKTIAQLPASYSGTLDVTLNDLELDIVVRNAIMLLVAFIVDNTDDAVDCIIHVWYSARIRTSHLEILQQRIRPLVQEVCDKTREKDPRSVWERTWTFGQNSLRLVLAQSAWNRFLSYLDVPPGLDAEKANRIRRAVTLAESRQDYRDRHFLFHSPSHRMAKYRFWEDGLLLPFGSRRDEFAVPNPTLFQTPDAWPLFDNADPLNGWLLKDIYATSSGAATADVYGKMFYHVRGMLESFLRRLSGLTAKFQLLQVNALELPEYLELDKSFSRIEVANIADCGYVGPHRTVALMARLLQEPAVNPHATLITLFMNAVDENMTHQDRIADATQDSRSSKALLKYIRPTGPLTMTGNYNPAVVKFSFARDLVTSYGRYFDRFMKEFMFAELGEIVGAAMKDRHTVIEKWPYRLRLSPGQPGAQEEFDRALGGGPSSKERYVEWKRVYHVRRRRLLCCEACYSGLALAESRTCTCEQREMVTL